MRDVARHWLARHATLWAQQSVQRQSEWNKRAFSSSLLKTVAMEKEEERLLADLEALIGSMKGPSDSVPLTMASAALSQHQLEDMGSLLVNENFRSAKNIMPLRDAALSSPVPWSKEYLTTMGRHAVWAPSEPEMPQWAMQVINDRDFFNGGGDRGA